MATLSAVWPTAPVRAAASKAAPTEPLGTRREATAHVYTQLCASFRRQCSGLALTTSSQYRLMARRVGLALHYRSLLKYAAPSSVYETAFDDIASRYKALQARLEAAATVDCWDAVDLHVQEAKAMSVSLVQELEKLLRCIRADTEACLATRSVKRLLLHELPTCFLGVFSYLSTGDIVACHAVCTAWHLVLSCEGILSYAMMTPATRWSYWRHFAPSAALDYRTFVRPSAHDELMAKEVARTTFYPKELLYPTTKPHGYLYRLGSTANLSSSPLLRELHAKLMDIFRAYACFSPHTGYGHGMTLIASSLLTCLGYDTSATFVTWTLLMEHRLMGSFWDSGSRRFGHGLEYRLHELTYCMYRYLPHLSRVLQKRGISTAMFATSWILSLFLNERSLPPAVCAHILDAFISEGWCSMFALYMGLFLLHDIPASDDTSTVLRSILALPRHLGEYGLGRYRYAAYTTLSPPLGSLLAMYEADVPPTL
ncbi:hypothetical protein SPRG_10181 [Saprolegnia parasitica CBS 223.65]|uniref:Rab-GAP TBC domain-containing protein n=1 Tax=Saprolegnia parasitica (strain CBS 223.65) TaxID=695850 RepID=A0A067C2A3_SAPPC|nr:hypothetical protein SPRG_10181 [Saprolegnia parasitica CBS 223.65]KDO24648.1 hypothetical protein SPRG_10181 [Saprolegnia parasitica CBS 223.65]|eukprot:XP_012204716.1 hypothetical protein SPRG_10181 [Saprolegnia parasitica CBS 223.65]